MLPSKLNIDASVDQASDELRALLEQQAHLEAKIAIAMSKTSSSRQSRSPIYKRTDSSNVPRSQSFSSPMSRRLSDRGSYPPPMHRTVSGPQPSAPRMTRTKSNLSGNSPFTKSGPVPPFPTAQKDISTLDHWRLSGEDPLTEYTFAQPTRASLQSGLENVGEDVAAYLNRTSGGSTTLMPSNLVHHDPMLSRTHLCPPVSPQQFGLHSPISLYSEPLTNGTTLPSDMASNMSRQSSEGLIGGVGMLHVNSNSPIYSDEEHNLYYSGLGHHGDEQTQLLFGAGGASQTSTCCPSSENVLLPSLQLENMQRSPSSESTSSNTSSRYKTQLQRQNQLANTRPLAAKPVDKNLSAESTSQVMSRTTSDNGSEEKAVQAIAKTPYQRPQHPKVYCRKCDDFPDGFRGEHELRRHNDRQHKVLVKKWICIAPQDNLSGPDHPEPSVSLMKCKACTTLQKRYGAYYNAAAHLRRAHFNPKTKGRGKGAKNDGKSTEKRGGKGGGDWPPMNELKRWMVEVEEYVSENDQPQPEAEDESDVDYMNVDYSEASNSANLIANTFSTETSMLDYNTSSIMNHDDLQSQNMHVNMHLQHNASNLDMDMSSANIDTSAPMFYDATQEALLMGDMNDISLASHHSSFPYEQQQQQQVLQQLNHNQSDEFESLHYTYNM